MASHLGLKKIQCWFRKKTNTASYCLYSKTTDPFFRIFEVFFSKFG
jgi:hypothetical protein